VIFLITDADFHDSDVETNYPILGVPDAGRTATLATLTAAGVKVFPLLSAFPDDVTPQQGGGRLTSSTTDVASLDIQDAADELARVTGGGVFDIQESSALFAPAVATALQQISEEGTCGDGTREGAEQCDGDDDDLCPGACGGDCRCPLTSCGNNIQEGGEQCDGLDAPLCRDACKVDCTCAEISICGNNTREGAETCDGLDDSQCPGECQLDCTCPLPPVDHFMAYKSKFKSVDDPKGKFFDFGPVVLRDQFETAKFSVNAPRTLLLPADKNDEGRFDRVTHLKEYPITRLKSLSDGSAQEKFQVIPDVRIVNQCSDVFVELKKEFSLMVPTNKNLDSPADPVREEDHLLDHFKCYLVKQQKKLSDGTELPRAPKGTQVVAQDQFQRRVYDLKKIRKLCLPTDKDLDPSDQPLFLAGERKGEPKDIEPSFARNPVDHLVCYRAVPAKKTIPQDGCGCDTTQDPRCKGEKLDPKQPKSEKRSGFLNNQFGPETFAKTKEYEFCVPSFKNPICGDDRANLPNEECDGADDGTCPGRCLPDCTCAVCGNGIREAGEECDEPDADACPGQCSSLCTCSVIEDLTTCIPPVFDTWEFDVTAGQSVFLQADTVDAATAADLCFDGNCASVDFFSGDDDVFCTFPPPDFRCPEATFVATTSATCSVDVTLCSSACSDPTTANYGLRVTVDGVGGFLTLVVDDGASSSSAFRDVTTDVLK
jgi:hypothetical protein